MIQSAPNRSCACSCTSECADAFTNLLHFLSDFHAHRLSFSVLSFSDFMFSSSCRPLYSRLQNNNLFRIFISNKSHSTVVADCVIHVSVLDIQSGPKKRYPGFNWFCDNFRKCTPILTIFLLLQQECMTHKSKITPVTSHLFCNPHT